MALLLRASMASSLVALALVAGCGSSGGDGSDGSGGQGGSSSAGNAGSTGFTCCLNDVYYRCANKEEMATCDLLSTEIKCERRPEACPAPRTR